MLIYADSGGEKFIGFAKKKLALWKAEMRRSGVRAINRTIYADDAQIHISSLMLDHKQFIDKIRIFVPDLLNGRGQDNDDWYYNTGSRIIERTPRVANTFHDWNKSDRLTEVQLTYGDLGGNPSGEGTLTISRRVKDPNDEWVRTPQTIANIAYVLNWYSPGTEFPLVGGFASNVGGMDQAGVFVSYDGTVVVARSAVPGETFVVMKWNGTAFDVVRLGYPDEYLALKAAFVATGVTYTEADGVTSPLLEFPSVGAPATEGPGNAEVVSTMYSVNSYASDTAAFMCFNMSCYTSKTSVFLFTGSQGMDRYDGSAYNVVCSLDIETLTWTTEKSATTPLSMYGSDYAWIGPVGDPVLLGESSVAAATSYTVCCRTDGSWFIGEVTAAWNPPSQYQYAWTFLTAVDWTPAIFYVTENNHVVDTETSAPVLSGSGVGSGPVTLPDELGLTAVGASLDWAFSSLADDRAQLVVESSTEPPGDSSLLWVRGNTSSTIAVSGAVYHDPSCQWLYVIPGTDPFAWKAYLDGALVVTGLANDDYNAFTAVTAVSAERDRLFIRIPANPLLGIWISAKQQDDETYAAQFRRLSQYDFTYTPDETVAVVAKPV